MKKLLRDLSQLAKVVVLALILSLGVSYVRAWTGPTLAAPGGNVSAPVNLSATSQVKSGGLWLGSLGTDGGASFGGAVGVGTTTPGQSLDVFGVIRSAQGDVSQIGLELQNYAASGRTYDLVSGIRNVGQVGFSIFDKTANATIMTIDATGAVGIGTTGPGAKLDVQGGASTSVIACFGDTPAVNAAYPCYTYVSDANTINFGYNVNGNAAGYINYVGYANGNTQFRDLYIDNGKTGAIAFFQGSTSNVGIGTASPDAKLDVNGRIVGGFGADSTGGVLDWNDVSNSRAGSGASLLQGSATNGPGGSSYYHPFNFEYGTKDGSGNVTQLAIPYGSPGGGGDIYMRGRYSGAWSAWSKVGGGTSLLGSGTSGYVPKWNGTYNLTNSQISDNGTTVTIPSVSNPGLTVGNGTTGYAKIGSSGWYDDGSYLSPLGARPFYIRSTIGTSYIYSPNIYLGDGASANNVYFRNEALSGTGWSLSAAGAFVASSITAGTFTYSSDISLKKNIETIPNALDSILKLRGVEFNWKKDGRTDLGVIAQEVEKVYPQLVHTNATTGLKSVEYGNLVGPLIEAVKELAGKVADIAASIGAFKDEITLHTNQINSLQATVASQQKAIDELQAEVQALRNK